MNKFFFLIICISGFFQYSFAASEPAPEVKAFLRKLPPDFSQKQIQAMKNAEKGDFSALRKIRLGRPDTPSPKGIIARNTEWNGVPVRIYCPEKAKGKTLKTVLYLHGGGWVIGNLKTCSRFCGELSLTADAIVIAVDYRLAPEHPYPAALDDVMKILKAARSPLPLPFGIKNDTKQVFLAGDSAGGNLSAAAALREYDRDKRTPAGLILFYPAVDLTDRDSASMKKYGKGYALDSDIMNAFIDCYLPGDRRLRAGRYVSPLKTDLSVFPPSLIVTAEFDVLHDQGKAFAEKLGKAGRRVIHRDYKGATHIFITVPGMDTFFNRAVKDAAEFLALYTVDAAAPPENRGTSASGAFSDGR